MAAARSGAISRTISLITAHFTPPFIIATASTVFVTSRILAAVFGFMCDMRSAICSGCMLVITLDANSVGKQSNMPATWSTVISLKIARRSP
eukprot:CAMPEP_0198226850 /NCGR_PEP_ID=MMETSP1445-20131203/106815_1 /TAXON_ID=36898 /ORGANISM="Pyramimonas sp., Strain CCMP2087" /LENGTH=91 /DNA_ID=CAMNT_0043906751 /DNA_START=8 /DNA_END=283 /DNA_ORIENTATION=+